MFTAITIKTWLIISNKFTDPNKPERTEKDKNTFIIIALVSTLIGFIQDIAFISFLLS